MYLLLLQQSSSSSVMSEGEDPQDAVARELLHHARSRFIAAYCSGIKCLNHGRKVELHVGM